MEITDIELIKLAVPYIKPQLRPHIQIYYDYNAAILKIHTNEGIVGISEVGGPERVEYEVNGARARLIGTDPFDIEKIVGTATLGQTFGLSFESTPYTISSIEMACWDIIGKKLKVPVYKLMGGRMWEQISITSVTNYESPESVVKECMTAVEQGISTIKIKVGKDPNQDLAIIKAVRNAVGDNIELRIDSNQAWSVPKAINMINKMARYDPQYIEQPIPRWDLDGFKRVRDRVSVPLCVCDAQPRHPEVMRLIKRDSIDFVSSDPYRSGGLLGWKKLAAICEASGIPLICHLSGLGVSSAAYLHATVTNHICMYAHDIKCSNLKVSTQYLDDIITKPFEHVNGYLNVPEGPGLGVELDDTKVKKWSEYYLRVRAKPKVSPVERYGSPNLPLPYYFPPRH